jgi:hypothetical protein
MQQHGVQVGFRRFSLALLARPPATFVRPCRGGVAAEERWSIWGLERPRPEMG